MLPPYATPTPQRPALPRLTPPLLGRYLTNRLQLQLLMAERDMIDAANEDADDLMGSVLFPGVKVFNTSHPKKMKITSKIQHLHGEVASSPPCTTF